MNLTNLIPYLYTFLASFAGTIVAAWVLDWRLRKTTDDGRQTTEKAEKRDKESDGKIDVKLDAPVESESTPAVEVEEEETKKDVKPESGKNKTENKSDKSDK
jgi:hypothetical protein